MTAIAVGGSSESGLRWPNYVNGRLLTAQDLDTAQDSVFTRDRWLGLAIGAGVVSGFEVGGAPGSTTLAVSPGVGVSRDGTAIRLAVPVTLDLTVVDSLVPPDGSRFAECRPPDVATKAPTAGAYLLAVCPQTWFEGKVPVQGAEGSLPKPCVSRWEVEGVVFKAIRLDGFTQSTTGANRRNLLAHWCFGSSALHLLAMKGFKSAAPIRGLDKLAATDLAPCDLPLAVFDWTGQALTFADLWSARRRTVRPSAATIHPALVGDDRTADGESRLLQFQDQVNTLVAVSGTPAVRALDVFPTLPPAGLLPLHGPTTMRLLKVLAATFTVTKPEPTGTVVGVVGEIAGGLTISDDVAITSGTVTLIEEAILGPITSGSLAGTSEELTIKELAEMPGAVGLVAGGIKDLDDEVAALKSQVDKLSKAVTELSKGGETGGGGPGGGGAGTGGADGGEGGAPPGELTAAEKADRAELALQLLQLFAFVGKKGFDLQKFFAGVNVRLGVVGPETVDFVIRRSWYDEAIGVGTNPTVDVFFILDDDQTKVAPFALFSKRLGTTRWLISTPGPLP